MAFSLREIAGLAIRYGGLSPMVRRTIATRRATIVVYHNPKPHVLDGHLAYLKKRYRVITLRRLVDAIHAGDFSTLPRKALVVTIDDGHRGNVALEPVFKRHGVRPTVYITSQVVATKRHFWFREPTETQQLKRLPHHKRLLTLKAATGYTPTREYEADEPQALTLEDLHSLSKWADFGSHTQTHPVLPTCSDDEARIEIADSKSDVRELTGGPCKDFCYPNGDYGPREIQLVRDAGYESARAIDAGWNSVRTSPYALRVTGVTDDASINILAAQLTGIPMYLRYLRKGSWTGRSQTITLGPQDQTP